MPKYRKKPITVEAYQTDVKLDVETLEGTMHANVGDWIITGVKGERYPCKPDVFEATYEEAMEDDQHSCEYCKGHGDKYWTNGRLECRIRKGPDGGWYLQISSAAGSGAIFFSHIPVNYCPICGRKLSVDIECECSAYAPKEDIPEAAKDANDLKELVRDLAADYFHRTGYKIDSNRKGPRRTCREYEEALVSLEIDI